MITGLEQQIAFRLCNLYGEHTPLLLDTSGQIIFHFLLIRGKIPIAATYQDKAFLFGAEGTRTSLEGGGQ
jgi:hypothetical protein